MYETERQVLQSLVEKISDKGWDKPQAEIHIDDSAVWIVIQADHPIEPGFKHSFAEYCRGDDLNEAASRAREHIAELVTKEDAVNDLFRKKIAELLKLGDAHGMEETLMASLRADIAKLSENIIEDKTNV